MQLPVRICNVAKTRLVVSPDKSLTMLKKIILPVAVFFTIGVSAQEVGKVSLQASGLTCSMCSNAINKALKSLDFVEKVDANIKNSSFEIYFKDSANIDFNKLKMKVEDAGFSVASFTAVINFKGVKMLDDNCVLIGENAFQFINTKEGLISGEKTVKLWNKGFVLAREYKKNSNLLIKAPCYERIGQKVIRLYYVTI